MSSLNLTPELLAAALQGLQAQQARLDAHIAEVKRMLGAGTRSLKPVAPAVAEKAKRKMTAAGRRRIAEAARKRWAAFRRRKAKAAKE